MTGNIFVFVAPVLLFIFNSLTDRLCTERDIPADKHFQVFRTVNVLLTILLISVYIENVFS
ncbi:hypothetical protein ACFQPF_14485 [Fictibacillus iocasae]|uniref:DUF4181 domain-containing protein n=1 Tax=Fictibacillus iocasae TaxID=2715437 RepID=A0ABW2NQY2_9BACL